MKEIEIITERNHSLSATTFISEKEHSVLIIASATGVKQSFYKKFATFISAKGITVITFDYQGIGGSLKHKLGTLENNAQEWGSLDLESVIQYATKHHPNAKLYLLGHSIGGQLIGLAESSVKAEKIILVAAQTGYWKYWTGTSRIKMWMNWHIAIPLLTSIFGYMPSKKIMGMENLPKNVAKQWSSWGRHESYLFGKVDTDQQYHHEIDTKLTAFSIEHDEFAPKNAVDWMTSKYSKAQSKIIHLESNNFNVKKIGHFGIFKEKFKGNIWEMLLKELE